MPWWSLILLLLIGWGSADWAVAAGSAKTVKIPILMYHHIRDIEPGDIPMLRNLSCPPELFQQHLQHLKEQGYQTLTFKDVKAYLQGKARLPAKPVILSFDDGYEDNFWAYLQLRQYNMKGVFFVVAKTLGQRNHLTLQQIREMNYSGMEIGSHSIHHADLRHLLPWKVKREIEESQKFLNEIIEEEIISFCYPSGAYNARVLKVIRNSNYWFARTTEPGISGISGKHFELRTVRIYPWTQVADLAKHLEPLVIQARQ